MQTELSLLTNHDSKPYTWIALSGLMFWFVVSASVSHLFIDIGWRYLFLTIFYGAIPHALLVAIPNLVAGFLPKPVDYGRMTKPWIPAMVAVGQLLFLGNILIQRYVLLHHELVATWSQPVYNWFLPPVIVRVITQSSYDPLMLQSMAWRQTEFLNIAAFTPIGIAITIGFVLTIIAFSWFARQLSEFKQNHQIVNCIQQFVVVMQMACLFLLLSLTIELAGMWLPQALIPDALFSIVGFILTFGVALCPQIAILIVVTPVILAKTPDVPAIFFASPWLPRTSWAVMLFAITQLSFLFLPDQAKSQWLNLLVFGIPTFLLALTVTYLSLPPLASIRAKAFSFYALLLWFAVLLGVAGAWLMFLSFVIPNVFTTNVALSYIVYSIHTAFIGLFMFWWQTRTDTTAHPPTWFPATQFVIYTALSLTSFLHLHKVVTATTTVNLVLSSFVIVGIIIPQALGLPKASPRDVMLRQLMPSLFTTCFTAVEQAHLAQLRRNEKQSVTYVGMPRFLPNNKRN